MLSAARRAAGYSLIELAVAGAILGAVLLYVFDTFTAQHQTYSVVEQVAETQQNARALAGLIERNLRGAGYTVDLAQDTAGACDRARSSPPDLLLIDPAIPEENGPSAAACITAICDAHDVRVAYLSSPPLGSTLPSPAAILPRPLDASVLVGAVREAADAVTRSRAIATERSRQRDVVRGLAETRRLNAIRVSSGLQSQLGLIDPDIRQLEAEQADINLAADAVQARIALAVALGGGFSSSSQGITQ